MIWSVSTLGWSTGSAGASRVVKGSMARLLAEQAADVGETAGDRGGRGHRRADEMSAHAGTLAADEVAVGGRGNALARLAGVAVHADAHRAAGLLAPFEAGVAEHLVEALGFGLLLHQAGASHDPG